MQGCRQGRINALLPSHKRALVSLWQLCCSPLWCVWPALDTHHVPVLQMIMEGSFRKSPQ